MLTTAYTIYSVTDEERALHGAFPSVTSRHAAHLLLAMDVPSPFIYAAHHNIMFCAYLYSVIYLLLY